MAAHNPLTDEQISSPSQIFGEAKKLINNIFVNIQNCVAGAFESMTDVKKMHPDVIDENELESIYGYRSKVKGICEVLTRDHMKVAFIGRPSSGKSTVLNAMLGEDVLPNSVGLTTNCILQVEGSQTGDAFLVTEGSNEKRNVESITHLAHAQLCKDKLNPNELVHVYWPKDKCSLLRYDVALVDTPGLNANQHLNDLIYAHCINADVFVLVVNHQPSHISCDEKDFFHKVSTKLCKPNMFILFTFWDVFPDEPDFIEQQHTECMEIAIDLLVSELKVCTPEEAVSRIFFISAKEALQARVEKRTGQALDSGALNEGFSARYMEFEKFERRLEECISISKIKTKFLNHSQQGKYLLKEMDKIMETIYNRYQKLTLLKMCQRNECQEILHFTKKQLIYIPSQMRRETYQVVGDVKDKVSKALKDEIRRLSALVDEFNLPFHSEKSFLNVYKKELHKHVVSGIGRNMRAKLSAKLTAKIYKSQEKIINKMSALLPEDKLNIKPRGPFKIMYRLRCDNLCGDFQEQLKFKFPSISTMVTRISSLANWTLNQAKVLISPSHIPSTIAEDSSFSGFDNSLAVEQNLSMISRVVGTLDIVGGLVLPGFMLKTFGWRLNVAAGVVYGVLYLYERWSWTTRGKEREFKRQYVDYATSKLSSIVDPISKSSSHQVQRELSTFFEELCQLIDESATNLSDEIKNLDQELNMITMSTEIANMIRNNSDMLKVELNKFDETFLCVDN